MRELIYAGLWLGSLVGLPGQDALPPPVDTMRFAGVAVDTSGNPLVGVKIECYLEDYRSGQTVLSSVVVSQAGGKFETADLEQLGQADWGHRFYFLVAQKPGLANGVLTVRSTRIDPGKVRLTLGEPAHFTATVRDPDGAPLPHAHAWVWMVGELSADEIPAYWGARPLAIWSARTDDDGRFELSNLPSGKSVTVKLWHPLHAEMSVSATVPAAMVPFEMALGSSVVGRVLRPDGSPAVRVKVQTQGVRDSAWRVTLTDADGRYRLESLPDDAYNIWSEAPGLTVKAVSSLAVTPGAEQVAPDLQLIAGGFIRGRVVDADGVGVKPGITGDVGLMGPSRPRPGAAIECADIGADGRFEFRVPPGANHVYLRAGAGWVPIGSSSFDVEVDTTAAVEVVFRVERANDRRARQGK